MGTEIEYEEGRGWRSYSTVSMAYETLHWVKRPETILKLHLDLDTPGITYWFNEPDPRVTVPSVTSSRRNFGRSRPEGTRSATYADYARYMRAVWVGSCLEVRERAQKWGGGYWRQRGFEGLAADPTKPPVPG